MNPFWLMPLWYAVVSLAGANLGAYAQSHPKLHYTSNANFDSRGAYLPAAAGFNLADVSRMAQLNALPDGVKGLIWLGMCRGVDDAFRTATLRYKGHPKLFGFYLFDDAYGRTCSPANLRQEADWIHAHIPQAIVFVALANGGSAAKPSFAGYGWDQTHADKFGIAAYPCRTDANRGAGGCDLRLIDEVYKAALAAGIPRDRIVPIFQTFGGGSFRTEAGGSYLVPTPEQLGDILARWDSLTGETDMDYSYSWGVQQNDQALSVLPELQAVIKAHNN